VAPAAPAPTCRPMTIEEIDAAWGPDAARDVAQGITERPLTIVRRGTS